LGEEAEFLVSELMRVELVPKGIIGKKLSNGHVERKSDLGQGIERGDGMAVLNPGKIAAQESGFLLDIAL
jgi:hypothetical protein